MVMVLDGTFHKTYVGGSLGNIQPNFCLTILIYNYSNYTVTSNFYKIEIYKLIQTICFEWISQEYRIIILY